MGEGSSVGSCAVSILWEEGVILLPLCTASAVTECGSSLVEELINGEQGGKNIMYLSVQETVEAERYNF